MLVVYDVMGGMGRTIRGSILGRFAAPRKDGTMHNGWSENDVFVVHFEMILKLEHLGEYFPTDVTNDGRFTTTCSLLQMSRH